MRSGSQEWCIHADWFSTWCQGCQRIYPELCKLAATYDSEGVKFVKANTEKLKQLAKDQQVKAMPHVGLYRPGHGRLLGFQAVPAKMAQLKENIKKVLANQDKFFKVDLNGFAIAVDRDPTPELTQMRKDAESLKESVSGLADQLMASANGSDRPSSNGGSAAGSTAGPVSSSSATSPAIGAHSNGVHGNGTHGSGVHSNGLSAPQQPQATPSAEEAKQQFLQQWGQQYGYSGQVDNLYARELGMRLPPDQHYLDYTGSGLYCRTPLQAAFDDLQVCLVLSLCHDLTS